MVQRDPSHALNPGDRPARPFAAGMVLTSDPPNNALEKWISSRKHPQRDLRRHHSNHLGRIDVRDLDRSCGHPAIKKLRAQ